MPLSPELKILDLIIEAVDKARERNKQDYFLGFDIFAIELRKLREKIEIGTFSCDECNAEKTEVVAGDPVEIEKHKVKCMCEWTPCHHPQETGGEECSGIRFSHNESGMVHIKCPPCNYKFLEAQRFAEAKGAEKERERISTFIQEVASRDYGDEQPDWKLVRGIRAAMGKEILKAITPPTP